MSKDKVMTERSDLSAVIKINYSSINWKQIELIRKKVTGCFRRGEIWEAWRGMNKGWREEGAEGGQSEDMHWILRGMVNRRVWAMSVSMDLLYQKPGSREEIQLSFQTQLCAPYASCSGKSMQWLEPNLSWFYLKKYFTMAWALLVCERTILSKHALSSLAYSSLPLGKINWRVEIVMTVL